ncbi:LysE family translocator [Cellulomonas sp. Leaf334]|uniref:LysE family translocator n=1 Tax=Cellulomonas sp. Leaf334 TaxID=1736339 RepID=UPI0006FAB19E|nr:LysE family translocator [Cellulomonas sp. Leaf334]KQR17463.1 lysine transporter LysE [Cellulomonas sp. Leaf334]
MTVPQAVLGFAVVAGLLTIIPGIDTALVLRSAISRGRAYAFAAAAGINVGCLVWGVAAAVGASALLAASELAYRILTLAGAAYMVWLGISLLRTSLRPHRVSAAVDPPRASVWHGFVTGLWTNLLNPKIGVFYLATIAQFVPADTSPLLMGVLLAAVHNVLGMAWFTVIILATGFAARWLARDAVAKVTDRITGTVLVAFGAKLALDAR